MDVSGPNNIIAKKFQHLYDNPHGSDVTLKIGDTTIRAHRLVLCAWSDYWKVLLSADSAFVEAKKDIIELKEDNPMAMVAIIRYMYGHALRWPSTNFTKNMSSFRRIGQFVEYLLVSYNACQKYLMDDLKEVVFGIIVAKVSKPGTSFLIHVIERTLASEDIHDDKIIDFITEEQEILVMKLVNSDVDDGQMAMMATYLYDLLFRRPSYASGLLLKYPELLTAQLTTPWLEDLLSTIAKENDDTFVFELLKKVTEKHSNKITCLKHYLANAQIQEVLKKDLDLCITIIADIKAQLHGK